MKKKLFFLFVLLMLIVGLFATWETPIVKASTTRVFYSLTGDTTLYGKDGSYSTARNRTTADGQIGASLYIGQWNNTYQNKYEVYRSYLHFDTSILPSKSTILEATLSLNIPDFSSVTTDFNVTIQNGQPTYPHYPVVFGDYYHAQYSGSGGTKNTSAMSSGYNNITFNAQGKTWIKLQGTTKLCLRSSRDIDGTTPSGEEYFGAWDREQGESYAPKLYVTYDYFPFNYILHGAFNEQGTRDGAINVTLYKATESPETFELDGTENKSVETTPVAFHFDLGYNQCRIYYLKDDFEEIYVFKPTEPYDTYLVSLVDYVGITNPYLETLINVNGTDRVVERWKVDVLNDLPFTLSWGTSYKFRLVCDQGTHIFGDYMAGPVYTISLTVTTNDFPPSAIHIGNITLNALRINATTIQLNYTDTESLTNWVYLKITEYRKTTPAYTTNNTGSQHQITWTQAEEKKDYIAYVQVSHQEEGVLQWSFSCPAPFAPSGPWDFDWLGDWPLDSSQIIGVAIVLCVFGVFSQGTAKIGIVATLLVASFLVYMGWLNINWGWMALVWCIGILAVFALREKRKT